MLAWSRYDVPPCRMPQPRRRRRRERRTTRTSSAPCPAVRFLIRSASFVWPCRGRAALCSRPGSFGRSAGCCLARGLHPVLRRQSRSTFSDVAPAIRRRAVRLRRVFENAGPTFAKLAQQLSMRADMLPYEYCAELGKMLDQAPAFPTEQAIAIIERSLGRPLERGIRDFRPRSDRIRVAGLRIPSPIEDWRTRGGEGAATRNWPADCRRSASTGLAFDRRRDAHPHTPRRYPTLPGGFRDYPVQRAEFPRRGALHRTVQEARGQAQKGGYCAAGPFRILHRRSDGERVRLRRLDVGAHGSRR